MSHHTGKPLLDDNPALLDAILKLGRAAPLIYKPGPYWDYMSRSAAVELKKKGLKSIRGYNHGAMTSFGDNAFVDMTNQWRSGLRNQLLRIHHASPIFRHLFKDQIGLTRAYYDQNVMLLNQILHE